MEILNNIWLALTTSNQVALNIITIPLTLILTLLVLFFLNAKLTLVCLIASPLIAIGTDKISKLIRPRIGKTQEMNANMSGIMQENMRGIEVIKIFSKEDVEVDRYVKYNIRYFLLFSCINV